MEHAPGLNADDLGEVIATQSAITSMGLDVGKVMELVCERARTLTGASGAVVEIADADDMVYTAAAGSAVASLGFRVPRAHSLSGLCVERGEVLVCRDSETDARVDREACRRVGLRSMLVAPLSANGRNVGVLKVFAPEPDAFAAREEALLVLLAGFIAFSIANARSYEIRSYEARHDRLTGLPNRAQLLDRLDEAVRRARRSRQDLSLLFVDLNGFKAVNDRYGHEAGDLVLVETARRLERATRETDVVARLGGDEFVVLCETTGEADAAHLAERIGVDLALPFAIGDGVVSIGGSVGVVTGIDDAGVLLARADRQMYERKRADATVEGPSRSTGRAV